MENPERLFQALRQLAEKTRREGEPMLLNLGMVLQEIRWRTEGNDEDE